jgi:hypothetical protein
MLNRVLEIIVIASLLAMSTNAASSSAYKCHIKNLKHLNDSGELVDFLGDETFEGMKKEFVVDRDTGRMSGATTNHGPYGQRLASCFSSSRAKALPSILDACMMSVVVVTTLTFILNNRSDSPWISD